MKQTLLVSDLHFNYWDQDHQEEFTAFLEYVGTEAKTLILNGDMFDLPTPAGESFWPLNAGPLARLFDLVRERGVRLYYLAGNHDYSLRSLGLQEPLLSTFDPSLTLRLGPYSYHIEHGHRYDPLFQSHLYTELDIFEQVTGIDLGQEVEALLHTTETDLAKGKGAGRVLEDLVDHIGALWRHRGLETGGPPLVPLPEVFLPLWSRAAELIRQDEGVDFVVFGHTHHPSPPQAGYLNSGDWVTHRTYVVLDPDGPEVREWPTGKGS